MDIEFQWEDGEVLETDSGDGCTTVWVYLIPQSSILKMINMVDFMLHIFYHNKNKLLPKEPSSCYHHFKLPLLKQLLDIIALGMLDICLYWAYLT